jgi:hypothetical protein
VGKFMNKPYIPEDTMREMEKFFLKTSVPRIIKENKRRQISEKRDSENMNANNPNEFEKLSEEEKLTVSSWIATYLDPIKSFNERHSSYGMKHLFESSNEGFYISNGAFKGAMLDCGFNVKYKQATNWIFNVSARSRVFNKNKR